MRRTPLYYSKAMSGVDFGEDHPFRPERFEEFMRLLRDTGYIERFEVVEPPSAKRDDLLCAHDESYVRYAEDVERRAGFLTLDTVVLPGMIEAVLHVAGAVMAAGERVARDGGPAIAFGGFHHAGRDYGEGFCVFNDVAMGVRHLQRQQGIRRVMVVDTDAHHGNGTMDIFLQDPSVLFVSLHQDPRTLYPGRGFVHEVGEGPGEGFTVNVPMPVHAGKLEYARALDEIVIPLMREFRPDAVVRNGGSDPHHADILTDLGLDFSGLWYVNDKVARASESVCGKHLDLIVSGYGGLVKWGWLALALGTAGIELYPGVREHEPRDILADNQVLLRHAAREFDRTAKELKRTHSRYWSCMKS